MLSHNPPLANRHLLQEVTLTGFRLHPLMREFFALKLDESENGEEVRSVYVKALVEVAAEIPYPITLAQVAQFSPAIPHLKAIAASNLRLVPDEKLKDLFVGLAAFYYGQGAYAAAEPWQKKGVEVLRDRLGEEHHDYLGTLHNLAGLYQSQGRYRDAEPLYLKVRDIGKQVLGEEHPSYLTTLARLASLYKSQGRYGDAEPLYLKVRDIGKQVLGEEHPHYLIMLSNLASLYDRPIALTKLWKTTDLARRSVKISTSVLGRTHPATRRRTRKLWRILLIDLTLGLLVLFFASHLLIVRSPIALLQFLFALFLTVLLLR